MARPTKTGLNYYPMDVGFLRDKKVRLLKAEFGASSVLFVLYVLGKAYEEDGYFLKWDKDECLIAATELGESPAYISEVLQGCLSRSLFDHGVFQVFGVLTSAGIQRRYLTGCEKRADIAMAEEYWLLNIEDKNDVPPGTRAKLTFFRVSGGKNEVNSPGNEVNSPDNRQSKAKKSKAKKSKEESSAESASAASRQTPQIDIFQEYHFSPELKSKVQDWITYKSEKRQQYKPTGLTALLTEIQNNIGEYGEADVIALISECMASNWQGIIFDRLKRSRSERKESKNNAGNAKLDPPGNTDEAWGIRGTFTAGD